MCSPASQEVIRDVVIDFTDAGTMFTAFEVSLEVQRRQQEQNKPIERHNVMRHRIHTELEGHVLSGYYSRALRDVGADVPANVYFRTGADVRQYIPLNRGGFRSGSFAKANPTPPGAPKSNPVRPGDQPVSTNQPGAPVATPADPQPSQSGGRFEQGQAGAATPSAPVDPQPNDHGNPADGGRKPDARGTVTVPSQLMRNLGFNFRETAYVRVVQQDSTRRLAITKTLPSGVEPLATYTVDENLNVRVTAHTLASGGLRTGPDASYNFQEVRGEVFLSN